MDRFTINNIPIDNGWTLPYGIVDGPRGPMVVRIGNHNQALRVVRALNANPALAERKTDERTT